NLYPTRYYYPAPVMFYGKYNDYGSVEDCHGTQIPLLIKEIRQHIYITKEMKSAAKLSLEDILKIETDSGCVELVSRNIFRRALKNGDTTKTHLNHVVIRQDVLDQFLEKYNYERFNGTDYDTINYQVLVDSIDKYLSFKTVDSYHSVMRMPLNHKELH